MKYFPFVFLTLLFSACSSQSQLPENPRGHLQTEIKADAIKLFTFRFMLPAQYLSPQSPPIEPSCREKNCRQSSARGKQAMLKRQKKHSDDTKEFEKEAEQHLAGKLATTGYCRAGYIELDRFTFERELHIRGECKDGATSEDYQRFVEIEQ